MYITSSNLAIFRRKIRRHYQKHGRDLLWRKTRNPYHILVSEMMLQQTQTDRVIPKYLLFLKTFPTIRALAGASLREVLFLWQGLGYNRRAKFILETAKIIVGKHKAKIPTSQGELTALPGIGPYTSGAILVFAFKNREVLIETNIRTVYTHFFFGRRQIVHDREILELVRQTLPRTDPREWFYALMDYGAMLKQNNINLNKKSAHYSKQSKFEGSHRQLRGLVIKTALEEKVITQKEFAKLLLLDSQKTANVLEQLIQEGFFIRKGNTFILT